MATDIYCPLTQCIHNLPSGLCEASTIGLEERAGGLLTCTNFEKRKERRVEAKKGPLYPHVPRQKAK